MRRATFTARQVFCRLASAACRLLAATFILLATIQTGRAAPPLQEDSPAAKAQAMLASMSPEEKVGQIFIVNFLGSSAGDDTLIYDLIVNHYVGGVFLMASNDNIPAGEDAPNQLLSLNRQIQLNRWTNSRQSRTSSSNAESPQGNFIPLFIATAQEGDGYPYDQILNGVTPLPNEMAIGATWNTELARLVGNILGNEISALGINLLFGPSLDVLETPLPESSTTIGTRTFGGDPFWVGQMARAYITGVHQGSNGKVTVAATHFPGIGAADRPPEEEVATVRKSLEQLQLFDLAPFFDVTGNAPNPESAADALLASHIRYQGFQGNIRASTRPVSFDAQAFSVLLNLPQLATWRQQGGVVISDNLGSRAVRRFFESTSPDQPFDGRRVALNTFLAGNDLLYLGSIQSSDDPDSYTTIVRTLQFFAQKYREDPAFAERVDQSVARILQLKYRLYGTFTLDTTLPSLEDLASLGTSSESIFNLAREAATLISPALSEIDVAIPEPPNRSDRIVFITDVRMAQQCSQCLPVPALSVDALQQAVLRLYGPQAAAQVSPQLLKAYSFSDLLNMLDGDQEFRQLETDIRRANWVVFAMLNVDRNVPASQALSRFLNERSDLFQQKRLITFAFNAPYYLDATDVSRLTAYYGLYSRGPNFIDVAARILFGELRPNGNLPISVPGIGYDIFTATTPDPNQIISLALDLPQPPISPTATVEPSPAPELRVGDLITVRTGVILDHNGHPVPDGTQVQFTASTNGEVSTLPQVVATRGGIARTTLQIAVSGSLEIRAESEPAKNSDILKFDIPQQNLPPPTPTETPQPTPTPSPSPSPTSTPEPDDSEGRAPLARPHLADWFVATLLAVLVALVCFRIAATIGQVRWGVRAGFLAFIGGLLSYTYLALELPGSIQLLAFAGSWGIILATVGGDLLGILVAWLWRGTTARSHGEG